LVSIIIPTRDHLEMIHRCLHSLVEKTHGVEYEVIVMDDHSSDPAVLAFYAEIQALHPQVRVHANEGAFNYSRVNNQGAQLANGELVLFLNNDVEILHDGWLVEMVRWAQMPGVGMVGAKLLYPGGSVQHAGIVLGMTGHAGHLFAGRAPAQGDLFLSPEVYRNVSAVTGACMLVRRDVFERLGGFDENLMLVFNDVDLGVRFLQQGWRIVYTPAAELVHYEGVSRSRYMPPEDIRLGAERLIEEIARGDRCYSPNLSLSVNWPSFRRPGEPSAVGRLRRIVQWKG
jgi:GT2 family glycosyltransferase